MQIAERWTDSEARPDSGPVGTRRTFGAPSETLNMESMRAWTVAAMLALVGCGDNIKPPETCGNGKLDSGEQCDGETNCNADCTWVCNEPTADCAPVECQVAMCTEDHACTTAPATDGVACTSGVCASGACVNPRCGNAVVEPGEECDFGSGNGSAAGCQANCMFSCETLSSTCDDGNPCNGVETCGQVTDHGAIGQACQAGTAPIDGTSCGSNMICRSATCVVDFCGDGYVSGTEECDDGNAVSGDGCENNCTFSCLSSDSSRNCTPADPCQGQGTCNDTTHVCAAGTPLGDNTSCGGNNYCKSATCTVPACGNGIVEPGEQCDGGVGCTASCQWQCNNASTDCGTAPQCDMHQCSSTHLCQTVADSSQNGFACGTSGTCSNGACNGPGQTCGNANVEGTEQCDFGAGNGPGTGCESNCAFSCQTDPDCNDGNACDGAETCCSVTVNGQTGKQCAAGTPLANGASCAIGKICLSSQCQISVCGDGYVDANAGETCEPPNVGTCDANCHTIVCGDGTLEGSEQCDDGNTTNLDGCDSSCKFEQVQRMTSFKMAFAPSASCPKDALGGALVGNDVFGVAGARTLITEGLDQGILDGSLTINILALGLDDLTGTADSSMSFGVVTGSPAASSATYDGTSDLDWWYVPDASTIDASRVPLHILPGSISGRTATVGPGEVFMNVSFVGIVVPLDMFNTTIRTDIGTSGALTISTNGMNPGHLASEHDAPSLTSYLTMGTPGGTCSGSSCRCFNITYDATRTASGTPSACPSGELCGSTTAQSLYNVAVPSELTGTTCNYFYTGTNSLLDAYISGCKYAGLVTQITATQPDTSRDGHTYTFQTDSTYHVNACKKDGVTQSSLSGCLANAAYSSLFQFTTDRVIAR
jgi:cysteine-rich repeat protein